MLSNLTQCKKVLKQIEDKSKLTDTNISFGFYLNIRIETHISIRFNGISLNKVNLYNVYLWSNNEVIANIGHKRLINSFKDRIDFLSLVK